MILAVTLVLFPRLPIGRPGISLAQSNPGGKEMIYVHHLRRCFGSLIAVNRLSFSVHPGEAVALWGPNGAGKTTVLRCLLGLFPYEGTVQVAGYDVRRQGRAVRRLTGFVPQELNFHDDLTVHETMRFYTRLKKASAHPSKTLLQRLGLIEHAHKPVGSLSGGMKQRLALAVALLTDPPLLILDEPTANLDAQAREAFLNLLSEVKRAGKTLIFSSHRLEEVIGLADRVLVMQQGRLVADCSPAELSRRFGEKAVLKLHVPGEWIESAITMLRDRGFSTRRNGASVRVQVLPQEKGVPISVLVQAGIPVPDFDIEPQSEERAADG